MSLHTTDLGDHGSRIVFCHGLFGQGRNWTQIGKALAADHRVTAGRHAAPRPVGVERRVRLRRRRGPGGRAARRRRPGGAGRALDGRQDRDGARAAPPRARRAAVRRRRLAGGLRDRRASSAATSTRCRASTWPRSTGRADAEAALAEAVPNPTVRGFLLQNLRRDGRRLALAGQPRRARPRPRPSSAAGPRTRWPGPRRTTGRCCGSAGATSPLRARRVRAAMERLVPAQPPGDHQGRRALGALRAARGLPRGAAPLRRLSAAASGAVAGGRGRPRPRCGCRRRSSRSAGTGCGTGRAPRPRSRRRRRRRGGTSRRRGSRRSSPSRSRP